MRRLECFTRYMLYFFSGVLSTRGAAGYGPFTACFFRPFLSQKSDDALSAYIVNYWHC